jgi:pimeloyl-ACP methyl ester carboxylesterase
VPRKFTEAAISGIGATEFSKNSGRSELQLAAECSLAACKDAGVDAREIDGMITFTIDNSDEINLARCLGVRDLSFARYMTARGFIVALVDHLGIGDSSRPKDGYALSSDVLSEAADHVHGAIRAQVQAQYGNTSAHLFSIGVGHSMGGMITVLQQAHHHTHEAIVLLGFSTRGLPEYVPQPLHGLARDPVALRAQLAAHARQMFKEEPYPRLQPTAQSREMFAGDRADARGVAALKLAGDEPVLPVPGFHAILPDNVAPEAASIDVPVYVAVGDLDIVGPSGEVARAYERSRAVVSYVMPNTGHCHFLFASRFALFEAIAAWTRLVTQQDASLMSPV